jgi:hypothetical protein
MGCPTGAGRGCQTGAGRGARRGPDGVARRGARRGQTECPMGPVGVPDGAGRGARRVVPCHPSRVARGNFITHPSQSTLV